MTNTNKKIKPIRVAILGHRGIPNSYGGFETLAEELAVNLVGLGAEVSVYCRSNYFENKPSTYKGVKLIYLPTIAKKSLDTLFHTFLSVWHVFIRNTASVVIVVNVGNAPFALLGKLLGKKVVFCVDGLDWQRKKWGKVARTYLRICSYFAKAASHEIITDASTVHEFYKKERGADSVFIPYGTEIETDYDPDENILAEFKLQYKKYFIYVARFEPENNPLLVVKAHAASGSKLPLVMVGDNRYSPEFVEEIKMNAGKNVIFTGFLFGQRYKQLLKNSLAYVRAAEVGGHSPALIEAMGRSVAVIANDKKENREPLGDTGLFFTMDVPSLARQFEFASNNVNEMIERGKRSAQRAMVLYSWDKIAFEYFRVIRTLVKNSAANPAFENITDNNGKKKMLITGAGGALGRTMYKAFSEKFVVCATTKHPVEYWQSPLDVTDHEAAEKIVADFKPDYVVHLAAVTDLEACEKNLPLAYSINTLATKTMAQLSAKAGATFVYASTANVFSGDHDWYEENDEPLPLNVYGLTKQMGELMAEYYAPNHLILRLGWLLGGGPKYDKKFVGRIVSQISSGAKELKVVTDKIGTLSYAPDIARTLQALLGKGSKGTYHLVAPTPVSRYEIAQKVVSILGFEREIKVTPVNSSYFSSTYSTPRPKHECLAVGRLTAENIDTVRPWEKALRDYLVTEFAYAFKTAETQPYFESKPALA